MRRRVEAGLIDPAGIPSAGITRVAGYNNASPYRGKCLWEWSRDSEGRLRWVARPLYTAPEEFGLSDWVAEYEVTGESFLDMLEWNPLPRVEDSQALADYEAARDAGELAEYLRAPVPKTELRERVVHLWCPRRLGVYAFTEVDYVDVGEGVEDGAVAPDFEILREFSDKPWSFWDPWQVGDAVGAAIVAASTDNRGRLNFKEAWARADALKNNPRRDDPEFVARCAAKAGIPTPERMELPIRPAIREARLAKRRAAWEAREAQRCALPKLGWLASLIWTILGWFGKRRAAPTPRPYPGRTPRDRRILPTGPQAAAAMRRVRKAVWLACNQPKRRAPPPPRAAKPPEARVVRRRKA